MKKSLRGGFTMVELIFVIIVIGVLAAIALPRFTNVTEKAKTNSEIATMDNLASAIEWSKQSYVDTATPEWNGGADANRSTYDVDNDGYEEVYVNGKLGNLHFSNTNELVDFATRTAASGTYSIANNQSTLFNKVSQAGGKGMRIVGAWNPDGTPNGDDVILLTGQSSDAAVGIAYPEISVAGTSQDLTGKPDRNDVWVYNGKNSGVSVVVTNAANGTVIVPGNSIKLIDVTGTTTTNFGSITVNGTAVSPII